MIKDLFKKIDYYWFFLIITAILCFGYILSNSTMGIDDEIVGMYKNLTGILFSNRLGRILTAHVIKTWEYLPFWRDFLAMILSILGITMHVDNFIKFTPEIIDKKAAVVFSCLALSFPYIAFNSIFIVTCLEQGLILVLSAAAVYYFNKFFFVDKQNKYLVYTTLYLILIISLYESGVLYFLTASLFIIICRLIYPSGNFLKFKFKEFLTKALYLSVLSYIINTILIFIIEKIKHIYYFRANDFFRYDLSSFSALVKSFFANFATLINNFKGTLNSDFGSIMVLFCLIILFSIICYITIRTKNIFIFISGILIMLLPFSVFWISGNYEWYYRVYASFCMVEGITFILIYNFCKNNKIILNIFFVFVSLIVLYQTKEFNQVFYTENLKFNNDVVFANHIMYDLERLNLSEKPIIFTGLRNDLPLRHSYYTQAPELNISTFNWDRYNNKYAEIFVKRSIYFMRELGYKVKGYWEISDNNMKPDDFINLIKNNTKEMNIYPREDSIRDLGSFVLIKIGRSEFENDK